VNTFLLNFTQGADFEATALRRASTPWLNSAFATVAPAVSCVPTPQRMADGTVEILPGQCEAFFRLDRPRTYVAAALVGFTAWCVYKVVTR
jgi:hypothetical protein